MLVDEQEIVGEGRGREKRIVGFGAWQKYGKQSKAVEKKDEAFLSK